MPASRAKVIFLVLVCFLGFVSDDAMASPTQQAGNSNSQTEKPCRSCTDFRSWMSSQSKVSASRLGKAFDAATDTSSNSNSKDSGAESGSEESSGDVNYLADQYDDFDDIPLRGNAKKYGCPADIRELGRGSWTFLHTMAARYPDQPSLKKQQNMKDFIKLFAKFYPCNFCSEDFRKWIKNNPPTVESQSSLSLWFCDAHNDVNRKLSKPLFDCDLVNERWRDGWKDGSC